MTKYACPATDHTRSYWNIMPLSADLKRLLHQTAEQSLTVDEVHTYEDVVNVALIEAVGRICASRKTGPTIT